MHKTRIGIIGCGNVSANYLRHAPLFPGIEVAAVADLDMSRARERAEQFEIPRACTVEQLLTDPDIELVVNLTVPKAHYSVAMGAMEAGKHVFNEKPLAATRDEGQRLVDAAHEKGLRLGGAPETFLGSGQQAARRAIDDGLIGRPVAGTAFMMSPGPEAWHPDPDFFYQYGGGPLFDMGPYYLMSLLHLLGPVRQVTAAAGIQKPDRTIGSGERAGEALVVETPDHIAGVITFESGAIVTLVTSFAVRAHRHAPIEIYGTDASLSVPDPNGFDGEVLLCEQRRGEWKPIAMNYCQGYGRSVGVADMAASIHNGREHRASGVQALAVLDLMEAFLESARSGCAVAPRVPYQRPAPMPEGLEPGQMD